jgi:hypothetical protein
MGILFFGLSGVAIVIVLVFFVTQKRQRDAAWERYRERYLKRQQRAIRDEPIDPNFQFNKPE